MDDFSIVVATVAIAVSLVGWALSFWLRGTHRPKPRVLDLRAGAFASAFDQMPGEDEKQVSSVSEVDGLFEQELLFSEEDHSEFILRKIWEKSAPKTAAVRIDERWLDEKPAT